MDASSDQRLREIAIMGTVGAALGSILTQVSLTKNSKGQSKGSSKLYRRQV